MRVELFYALLVSFCVGAAGKSICGPEPCKDLFVAVECNKVLYCTENIWSKLQVSVKKDDVCNICLKMVEEAREQLNSNETIFEIKEVLEGSCKLMMVPPVVEKCMKLADEFAPELVHVLSSQMEPEVVCTITKLCNREQAVSRRSGGELPKDSCQICQKFVTPATQFFNNISQEEFSSNLAQICRHMGSFSDSCAYYTSKNPAFYLEETRQALNARPCELFGFCPLGSGSSEPTRRRYESGKNIENPKYLMCSSCNDFIRLFKSSKKAKAGPLIRENMYRMCRDLALTKDDCDSTVDENLRKFYEFVSQAFSLKTFCSNTFSFCKPKGSESSSWPLFPADNEPAKIYLPKNVIDFLSPGDKREIPLKPDMLNIPAKMGESVRKALPFGDLIGGNRRFQLPKQQISVVNNSYDCSACTQMFLSITTNAANDKEYVKNMLGFVCNDMPTPEICQSILENSAGQLGKILGEHLSPNKVCPELVASCEVKPGNELHLNSVETCNFCTKMYDSLREGWNSNSQTQASNVLNEMCYNLSDEYKAMCIPVMQTLATKTLPNVFSKYTGSETCGFLRLCGESPKPSETTTPSTASEPTAVDVHGSMKENTKEISEKKDCKTCMLIFQTILDEIEDKNNEDEVKRVLEYVCHKLPKPAVKTCELLVEVYSEDVIQMISQNLTPDVICKKLGFCRHSHPNPTENNFENVTLDSELSQIRRASKNLSCPFCLEFMHKLMEKLQENKTVEVIEHVINKICKSFPEEVKDTCERIIDMYTDDIVDMIIADFSPEEICFYLKLCKPTTKSKIMSNGFNVDTNEIRSDVCSFCLFLDSLSKDNNGSKKKVAEEMLALLVDVCMSLGSEKYKPCNKFLKEHILPVGADGILNIENICYKTQLCKEKPAEETEKPEETEEKKQLRKVEEFVQECAMCEAIVEIVLDHNEMMSKDYSFVNGASWACSSVPVDKQSNCESMLGSYGHSIVNLLVDKEMDPNEVCPTLSLCDRSQQTKIHMPVSDTEQGGPNSEKRNNECLQGPNFWCMNMENAEKCGTKLYCQEVFWNKKSSNQ